jgi:hypothetical protein
MIVAAKASAAGLLARLEGFDLAADVEKYSSFMIA